MATWKVFSQHRTFTPPTTTMSFHNWRSFSRTTWMAFCFLFAALLLTKETQALSFTVEPQDVVVPEGHSVLLQCAGSVHHAKPNKGPQPSIRWRGPNGQDLGIVGDTFRTQLKNGSLYISSVEKNRGLTGAYQCLLTLDHIGTIVSRPALVSIAKFPELNQDFIETYLLTGQTAYFRCITSQLQPGVKYTVQWYRDESPLILDKLRMVILPNGALEIDEVTVNDRGVYRCNVSSSGLSRLSSKTNLNIKKPLDGVLESPVPPTFLIGPSPQTVKEGDTVTLDCVANGVPKPQIKWLRNGEELDFNDLDSRFSIIGTGSLQISSAEDTDSGNYQCRASNSLDSLDAEATVQVQVPPQFIQSPKDEIAHEKDELELECSIRGKPKPMIKWLKNGDLITPSDYMQLVGGHNLRILGLLETDAGMFQCVGINPAGSVQAAARLKIVAPGKAKHFRKEGGHKTKSLDTNTPPFKKRKSSQTNFNLSGELRTKSIDQMDDSFEKTRIFSKAAIDSLMNKNLGSYRKSLKMDKPLNDRSYGYSAAMTNSDSEKLPFNRHDFKSASDHLDDDDDDDDDEDEDPEVDPEDEGLDEDNDDDDDNEDDDYNDPYIMKEINTAYKQGEDPNEILNYWTNKKKNLQTQKNIQDQSPSSSSSFLSPDEEINSLPHGEDGFVRKSSPKILDAALLARLPGPPRQLQAQVVKNRFVALTWDEPLKNAEEVVSYTVFYKMNHSEREQKITTKSHDEQQINIQSLIPGRGYQFRVVANTNFGPGESSEILEIKTQPEENIAGPPQNVEGFARNHKEIFLKWDPPVVTNGEITKYRIYYAQSDHDTDLYHDSNSLSTVLSELRPYTDYTIHVVPFNQNGMGDPSNEIKIRTFSSTPSEPPNNVTLEVTSSTSITIHWEPPSEEDRNGQITGYKIRYRKLKESPQIKSTPGNVRYFELNDLDRHSEYQVKIAAMTVNGTGPFTEWYRIVTLENDLDESQVPGKPVWIAIHPGGDNIALHWGPPQQHEIKIRSYVLGWGRGIPDENTIELKETDRYHVLTDLEPNTEYVVSLRARNVKGDGPPIYDNIKTRDEEPVDIPTPLEVPVGLRAITTSSSSIVVYWIDTTLNKNQHVVDNRHYTLRYTTSSSTRYRYHNTTDLNCMINDLKPDTQYEFAVKVVKGRRESAWSMSVLNTTYKSVPITPPRDLTIRADEQNPQNVILQWLAPKYSATPIGGYNIYYTTDTTKRDRDWTIEAFAGEETMMMLSNLKPYTTYYFKVQARIKGNLNAPFSGLVTYTTGGSVIMQDSKSISSFPKEYLVYIAIGVCVLILLISLVLLCVCRKKTEATPEHAKKSYQKNNVGTPKPPDLWIHHDQMELKNIDKSLHSSTPGCSDGASSSGALTLPRSVVHSEYEVDTPLPSHVTNSLDKRSYVPGYMTTSMNGTMERPQYPRTQYNIPANRSHMTVDTGLSQQSLTNTQNTSLAQTPEHPYSYDNNFCTATGYPHAGSGGGTGAGSSMSTGNGISTIESNKRGHPLKSFSVPGPPPTAGSSSTMNKHAPTVTIRPQNQSPYKKPSFSVATPTNRLQSGPSVTHSTDEIQRLAPSTSTEELNQEMANLEGLMKDLSAITANEFEC